MSASAPSGSSRPAIAWLGAAPPAGVVESLAEVAQVETEWTPDAELIAVWAPAGFDQLRRLPRRTQRPPVIAASNHEPTHGERMAWIRAGADDLVSVASLPTAIARRLQAIRSADASRSGSGRRDPTSLVEPLGLPRGAERGAAVNSRTAPQPANDAFPPLRVPQPDGEVPETVGPWVASIQRYLTLRDQWVGRWGKDGLDRLLELSHVRAQVPAAAAPEVAFNTFGQAHGTSGARLGWPILLRRGPSRSRQIQVAEGEVVHAGTDGLVLEVGFEASERQKLVGDLTVDDNRNAQFLLEARWQRRVSARRWQLGFLILEMRLRPLPQ